MFHFRIIILLLGEDTPRWSWVDPEMVEILDTCNFLHPRCKDVSPVISLNNGTSILSWRQLSVVAFCWGVDNLCYIACTLCSPILVLEQAKAPVWRKFCVPDRKEGESDGSVPFSEIYSDTIGCGAAYKWYQWLQNNESLLNRKAISPETTVLRTYGVKTSEENRYTLLTFI